MTRRLGKKGQATTEVALLFPIFIFFLLAFAKVFALLILMQKLQIASFYAARRWQLESHRNASYETSFDTPILLPDVSNRACTYMGYGDGCSIPTPNFLDLTTRCTPQAGPCADVTSPGVIVQRTQVWNVVITAACTAPLNIGFYKTQGFTFCDRKYVPNRDRPIAFVLPGLNPGGP